MITLVDEFSNCCLFLGALFIAIGLRVFKVGTSSNVPPTAVMGLIVLALMTLGDILYFNDGSLNTSLLFLDQQLQSPLLKKQIDSGVFGIAKVAFFFFVLFPPLHNTLLQLFSGLSYITVVVRYCFQARSKEELLEDGDQEEGEEGEEEEQAEDDKTETAEVKEFDASKGADRTPNKTTVRRRRGQVASVEGSNPQEEESKGSATSTTTVAISSEPQSFQQEVSVAIFSAAAMAACAAGFAYHFELDQATVTNLVQEVLAMICKVWIVAGLIMRNAALRAKTKDTSIINSTNLPIAGAGLLFLHLVGATVHELLHATPATARNIFSESITSQRIRVLGFHKMHLVLSQLSLSPTSSAAALHLTIGIVGTLGLVLILSRFARFGSSTGAVLLKFFTSICIGFVPIVAGLFLASLEGLHRQICMTQMLLGAAVIILGGIPMLVVTFGLVYYIKNYYYSK